MGKLVDSILARRVIDGVRIRLLDRDDMLELDELANQMASLINVLVAEHKLLHKDIHGTEGNMQGWNHKDILDWVTTGGWFLVALKGEDVVGVANIARDGEGYNELVLRNFCVSRKVRGHGIGHALLDALFALAKEQGCVAVALGVFANNTEAIKLYEREGFKPVRITMRRPV